MFDPANPEGPDEGFVDRRHERVARGVQRSRRGFIPTWVYAVILAVLVGAWIWWVATG